MFHTLQPDKLLRAVRECSLVVGHSNASDDFTKAPLEDLVHCADKKTKPQKKDVLSWQIVRPALQLSCWWLSMPSWVSCEAEWRSLLSWVGEGEG